MLKAPIHHAKSSAINVTELDQRRNPAVVTLELPASPLLDAPPVHGPKKRRHSKPRPDQQPPSFHKSISTATVYSTHITPLTVPTTQSKGLTMQDHDSDKKRNKLGYQRTSVACSHCRRRKIRCLMQEGDPQGRCQNCVKLKRECVFQPVDQNRESDGAPGPSSNARSETRNGNSSPRERPPRRESAASPNPSSPAIRLQSNLSATGYVGEPIPASDPSSSVFDGNWSSRPLSTAGARSWSPAHYGIPAQISPSSAMESPSMYDLQTNTMSAAPGPYGPVLPVRVQSPHHVQQHGQGYPHPHYPSETSSMRSMTPSTGPTGGGMPMYGLQDSNYAQPAMPRYSTQSLDASTLSQYPHTSSSYSMPVQPPNIQQYGQQSPYATFTSAQQIPSSYYTSQSAYGMDGQSASGSQYASRSRPP